MREGNDNTDSMNTMERTIGQVGNDAINDADYGDGGQDNFTKNDGNKQSFLIVMG